MNVNPQTVGRSLLVAVTLGVAAAACTTDASVTDLDEPTFVGDVSSDITAKSPDSLTVYMNTDLHPNIVILCIEGVAFRTISTAHSGGFDGSVARVYELDSTCD